MVRHESTTDVLIAGAGPVGLTMACELRRRGVDCRIVDRLAQPPRYAKAVGVQPRTVELWEAMGLAGAALDAAIELRGMIMLVNGNEASRIELSLPPEVPYRFFALPQYETERLLTDHLRGLGGEVERGVELTGFEQDPDGVTAALTGPDRDDTVRALYVVGADGAHSIVRKTLGLSFEGAAFPEEYMLGDVEVDWSIPRGMTVRSMHRTADGATDDILVCIPLPGHGRYRMSMLVPPDLAMPADAPDGIEHGFAADRPRPTLEHIQAVLDRLSPEPVVARNLRWSSIFRISHRIVDRYTSGRAFVCGDAAHIHPPTGAQGMNTGIQDAVNLAWKLALAVRGVGASGLLESYDAERRPVGEEVVGRTVRHARSHFGDRDDPETVMLREAQLLVAYPDSPIVSGTGDPGSGPQPGERAPDARGLTREGVAFPIRLYELFGGGGHTLIVAGGGGDEVDALVNAARERAGGDLTAYALVAPGADPGSLTQAVEDAGGAFAAAYGGPGPSLHLVRPDGYVGFRSDRLDRDGLIAALARVFA
jgi:2-polyprenyl-6-methoxyphenol hydroxylase-like FAD-dependent oxidoreductase